jgi:WD40 repeat protein
VPGPKGGLRDFGEALKETPEAKAPAPPPVPAPVKRPPAAEKQKTEKAKAEKPKPEKVKPVEKPAQVSPPRAAVEKPRAKQRLRPKPDVARSRSLTRGLKTKVMIAAALAGVGFAFHDRLPELLAVHGSAMTTGAISKPQPIADPALTETAEIRAHDGAIEGLALSGDGRLIVTASREAELRIWSFDSHDSRGTIALDDGPATALAVRNNRAVTGHADGAVAVYDLDSKRRLFRFKRNDAMIWSVAFVGSEDRIAAASHDWTVALWETSSEAAPAALLEGHESAVQALAVDPSGQWLASGGADRTVRVWDLETHDARRMYRNNSDFISAMAFSADGATLATGSLDGTVKLLSMNSYRMQRMLSGHNTRITSLAFSSYDDLMASASEDGVVRIRTLKRPRAFLSLNGIGSGAKALAFTNDGRTLLTGGQDGVVRLWSLPEPQLAQRN